MCKLPARAMFEFVHVKCSSNCIPLVHIYLSACSTWYWKMEGVKDATSTYAHTEVPGTVISSFVLFARQICIPEYL